MTATANVDSATTDDMTYAVVTMSSSTTQYDFDHDATVTSVARRRFVP